MNIQGSKISLESGKTKTPKSFTREVIEKSFGTSLVFDNVFKRTPSKNVCLAREYGDRNGNGDPRSVARYKYVLFDSCGL